MPDRRRRKKTNKKSSAAADVLRLIYALLLIIAAALIVYFVYLKVNDISKKGSTEESIEAETSLVEVSVSGEDESSQPEGEGLMRSEDGLFYLREDGSYAEDEWISYDGSLYYFGEDKAALCGQKLSYEGEIYTFDPEGRVTAISYDPNFKPSADEVIEDYPSLVKSRKLWAYLSEEKSLGEFNAIMYKRTTEARSYVLGGDENPQFSSPYSMQIAGDYIYFLPYSEKEDLNTEEKKINKTLYRMKPGDEYREIVAQNVEGYKAMEDGVYYMSSGKVYHTTGAVKDETKTVYVSNSIDIDDFNFEINEEGLFLRDREGNPVRTSDNSKRVGSFTYYLSEEGEVTGVREKTAVTTGGWTYYTETDTSTGKSISKIMRQNGPGEIQEVSSDFAGHTGNMFYDYSSGNLVAEYMPDDESRRLIIINENGDVDVSDSTLSMGSDMRLYALIDGSAIVRLGGEDAPRYETVSLSPSTPIAVGVISENIFVKDPSESEDNVTEIDSTTLSPTDAPGADSMPSPTSAPQPEPGGPQGGGIIIGSGPGE